MRLLYKLLKQNVSLLQLVTFLMVNLLGGVIVLLGVEAYCDFSSYDDGNDSSLSSGSVVINKVLPPNATINSLLGKTPVFSDEEIAELESLSSVATVGRFVAARFEIGAVLYVASSRMSTDIFLEAVPDEFVIGNYTPLDCLPCCWDAGVDGDTIPVIIPRNYLNLYNFGYAASNKMPQISSDMIGYLPLKLVFETAGGRVVYDAVICGLTDKFNTILVPWGFLNEANAAYAPGTVDRPSRLILTTDASEFDETTFSFLESRDYVVEGDATLLRMQNFVYGLIYVVVGVGVVFSILAFVLLAISIQLLIEKNKEKICNLHSIGFSVKEISRIYRLAALVADVAVWLVAAAVATALYPLIADIIQLISPGFETVSLVTMWFIAICFGIVFVIIHCCIIFVSVKGHCARQVA